MIHDNYFRRLIASFRLALGQYWLDVRTPETHQALRSELAETLMALGYGQQFVWGDVLGHDHRLTQAIAIWAFGRGYQGIAYSSGHDAKFDCWAIFEGARIVPEGEPSSIRKDDPDLIAVAELFELTIP